MRALMGATIARTLMEQKPTPKTRERRPFMDRLRRRRSEPRED
jgi:hypothetical protein